MIQVTMLRPKGRKSFYARWQVVMVDQAGAPVLDGRGRKRYRQVWKSLGTLNKSEARIAATAIEEELNRPEGRSAGPGRLRLSEMWEAYAAFHGEMLSKGTLAGKASVLAAFVVWADRQGLVWADEVTGALGAQYRAWNLEQGRKRSTINEFLNKLQSVWRRLEDAGHLTENPWKKVSRYPRSEILKEGVRRAYLTPAELELVAQVAAQEGRDPLLWILLGGLAGMRPGERDAMRWAWVTWPSSPGETGFIEIPAYDKETGWEEKTRKGRRIPLHPLLREVLVRYRQPGGFVMAPELEWDDSYTYRWLRSWWWKGFTRRVRAAGMEKRFSSHSMRHSFATEGRAQGIPDYKVMSWTGHSRSGLEMLDVYTHVEAHDSDVGRMFPGLDLSGQGGHIHAVR